MDGEDELRAEFGGKSDNLAAAHADPSEWTRCANTADMWLSVVGVFETAGGLN